MIKNHRVAAPVIERVDVNHLISFNTVASEGWRPLVSRGRSNEVSLWRNFYLLSEEGYGKC
jgi:hypothetical protein